MSTQILKASLPADALYVTGTVNGVETTWTNTEGSTWETTAARSADDRYRVELTMINELGRTSTASMELYYGLHLVTDRTSGDVAAGNDKGLYLAADLNRVGAAVAYLRDRLTAAGYAPTVSPKADWTDIDWMDEAAAARYLADLRELRRQLAVMESTPEVPETMAKLDYRMANHIEQLLEDLDQLLTHSAAAVYYSGELYSGEV